MSGAQGQRPASRPCDERRGVRDSHQGPVPPLCTCYARRHRAARGWLVAACRQTPAGPDGDDLAVREGAIDARPHRAEILLSHFRVDRSTSQFAIPQRNLVTGRTDRHRLEELRPDLMPQSPRAAVNAHHDVPFVKVKCRSGFGREDIHHLLHFKVMIPGSERTHLILLARLGMIRHTFWHGSFHAAMLFDKVQIDRHPFFMIRRPPTYTPTLTLFP